MTTLAAAQSAANAASAIQPKKDARQQIAGNFDQFLTLLTTQLRNQSPLEPLDTNQFTQQLVQFAQVEQQLQQNETLKTLLNVSRAATTANAMSFVGARVTMDGGTTALQNGAAEWRLNAPRAGSAVVTIRDAQGNTVASRPLTLTAGQQTFRWDGRTSAGGRAPDGQYSIVVDAEDATRARMPVSAEVSGTVDGVDFSGEVPLLVLGEARIALDKVKSVRR
jgi:flagellar basal-body rod modification protein FlgD